MKNIDNILKLITGNSDDISKKETIRTIQDDQELKRIYRKTKFAWALISSKKEMSASRVEESYRQLSKKIHKPTRSLNFRNLIRYAAVLVLFIAFSFLVYYMGTQSVKDEKLHYTSVVADNGQISKIVLPDSTVVWLNSGTTLTYNNNFSVDNRKLKLTGQAYLDVKRNIDLPLVVDCGELLVKVLGTRFDVSSYPDDANVNVILESGKVELRHTTRKDFRYQLKPGEIAQYNLAQKKINISDVEVAKFTSWKDGLLIFHNAKLADVVNKLQRKYGIEIIVENPELFESQLNAKFREESLEEIVAYIEFACHAKAHIIKDNDITTKLILK